MIKHFVLLFIIILVIPMLTVFLNAHSQLDEVLIETYSINEPSYNLDDVSNTLITWRVGLDTTAFYEINTETFFEIPFNRPIQPCGKSYVPTVDVRAGREWLGITATCGVSPDFVYFYHVPSQAIFEPFYENMSTSLVFGYWPKLDEEDYAIWIQANVSNSETILYWRNLGNDDPSQMISTNGRRPSVPNIDYPWVVYTEGYTNSAGNSQFDLIVLNLETGEKRTIQSDNSYQTWIVMENTLIAWTEHATRDIYSYDIETDEIKLVAESNNEIFQVASDIHDSKVIYMVQSENPNPYTTGWNQIWSFDYDTGVSFLLHENLAIKSFSNAHMNDQSLVWQVTLPTQEGTLNRTMVRELNLDNQQIYLPIVVE